MTKNKYNWLLGEEPKEVTVHTNRREKLPEEFDAELLASYGYKENSTIVYSVKQGKTNLLGNPFLMEGI